MAENALRIYNHYLEDTIRVIESNPYELIDTIADNVQIVADAFYPKPVWYRTLDAPTDEFITLEGGENEPREHNPMLGWRGIRRELDQPEILKCEFKAIKKLHEKLQTTFIYILFYAFRVDISGII